MARHTPSDGHDGRAERAAPGTPGPADEPERIAPAFDAPIDEVLGPRALGSWRRFPRLLARAFGINWSAAPRETILASTLQILAGLGLAVQVLLAKRVLTPLLEPQGKVTFHALMPSVILLAAVTALLQLASSASFEVTRVLSTKVERYAVDQVAAAANSVDVLEFERSDFHDALRRAQVAAMQRPVQMVTSLTAVLGTFAGIVGISMALIVIDPVIVLVLALGFLPVWLASRRSSRLLHDFAVRQTSGDRERSYLFIQLTTRSMASEVRAFSLFEFFRQRLDALYQTKVEDTRNLARDRFGVGSIGTLINAVLTVVTMALLVWLVTSGRIQVAEAATAAGAIVLLAERVHGIGGTSGSLYESTLYMEDFTNFVDRSSEIKRSAPKGTPPSKFRHLVATDLVFTYPSRTRPSLRGVSLDLRDGEIVALVGENGSGKTTLAKLLAGLYRPESGSIRWDGTDIATCEPEQLRERVTLILQDFGQYLLSARENIGIGNVSRLSDEAGIEHAARLADAHDFIIDLPREYDNLLGAEYFGGADISLGQWQRIALARGFFRDAPFVILDEPTASLDPRAEATLFENVRSLYQGRSVLLISHRFSSVRSADRIYVLDAGLVVEHGTHDELMAKRGLYSELFELQASSYGLAPEGRGDTTPDLT